MFLLLVVDMKIW